MIVSQLKIIQDEKVREFKVESKCKGTQCK